MRQVWVLAAILLAGCSGGHGRVSNDEHPPLPPVPNKWIAARATDVASITLHNFPEGPNRPTTAADPIWPKVVDALPASFPKPLSQPLGCKAGRVTRVEFKSGREIDYGPCRIPEAMRPVGCVLDPDRCSHDESPPTTVSAALANRATTDCRAALEDPTTFVNALATTVGAIHSIYAGEVLGHPWDSLYVGKPDSAFAAWCWRRVGDRYESYAVGPGQPMFNLGGTDSTPPLGPLVVT